MIDPELRIMILGTPKTGNTWLRNLLSVAYRLPQLTLIAWPFDAKILNREGRSWITHHHYFPTREAKDWIQEQKVILITMVRHPADVLVSMYYHVHGFPGGSADVEFLRRMLREDFDRIDIVPERLGAPFYRDLDCSLVWIESRLGNVVRYEDLLSDPAGVLAALTSRIRPVTTERIEAAVESCNLDLMRTLAGRFGGFFRAGRSGAWRDVLPPDIVEVFRSTEPYRSQVSALGYSMDGAAREIALSNAPPLRCPLLDVSRFDNGVPVAPLLVKCFLYAEDGLRRQWTRDLRGTGPDSFYGWLNATASLPGEGRYASLDVSNLAYFIYFDRHDLRIAFPDLGGPDRREFVQWFLNYASSEYGVDRAFVQAAGDGFRKWSLLGFGRSTHAR
jgi:hypothetical protein